MAKKVLIHLLFFKAKKATVEILSNVFLLLYVAYGLKNGAYKDLRSMLEYTSILLSVYNSL